MRHVRGHDLTRAEQPGDQLWVGLVRNVMLGREGLQRQVLLDLVSAAGGAAPASYLTTGNVTFEARADDVPGVTARFEASLAELLGRHELLAVRPMSWLQALIAREPFRGYETPDWDREVALVHLEAAPLGRRRLPVTGSTVVVEVTARELLTARPGAGPRGPHATPLLERLAGRPATARSWETLTRIAGRAQPRTSSR